MANRLVYVGHATVLIDLDGVRVLTDPVLRSRVLHLRRESPVSADVLRGVDAVLISHGHWDHLDLPSLDRLGRDVPVVCPRGLDGLLRRRGFRRVTAIEVGGDLAIGGVRVAAVHAEHDGGRGPFSRAAALGYVLTGSHTVYFAGDTDLFDAMEAIAGLDVALVPVTGWGPKVGPGHLDPATAAQALRLLRPRIAVPIHWGTFSRIGRDPDDEAPHEFARLAAEAAPDVEVRILEPGAELALSSS